MCLCLGFLLITQEISDNCKARYLYQKWNLNSGYDLYFDDLLYYKILWKKTQPFKVRD